MLRRSTKNETYKFNTNILLKMKHTNLTLTSLLALSLSSCYSPMKLTVMNKSSNTIVMNEEKENIFNKYSSSTRKIKISPSKHKQVSIGNRSLSGIGLESNDIRLFVVEQKNLISKYYEVPFAHHKAVSNNWKSRNYFSRLLNNKVGTLTYNNNEEVSLQFKDKSWTIKSTR